ncbi:MAG: hypothetical protein NC131_18225 [Roseburia sp.]|nr:hypothetical protein [Roseburia sp.]
MKSSTVKNLGIGILCAAIGIVGGYWGWTEGIPYLNARSQFAQEYPTIEKLEQEIVARNIEIDSLNSRLEVLEQKIELQDRLLQERDIQSAISSQLRKLQSAYDKNNTTD